MSKKIKTVVFSVNFWEEEKPTHNKEWRTGVDRSIDYDHIFTCPGSYSKPEIMENEISVIQLGIKNTKDYNRDWNYWRVGFMTAMYHLLLNVKDFDVAIHVQNSVLLNIDLNPYIKEFNERDEILASPQYVSESGVFIETALMMLKKEAIQKYITSPLRPSLSNSETINVEEEAFYMFKEDWWNFIPEVLTIRKNDFITFFDDGSPFNLNKEEFSSLPMISTSTSYTKEEHIKSWKEHNNL